MENGKIGIRIGKKVFLSSALILFILMILSGILTRIVPQGSFERTFLNGRTVIDPERFTFLESKPLAVHKWFLSPVLVLFTTDGPVVATIIIFILVIGGIFSVLEKSQIIKYAIMLIVNRFENKKYQLLSLVTFFFMIFGALLGIFEEIVPLVPIVVALSLSLGWDSLVGLGMSVLATGFGFSAALFNPFTIGVAQKVAGLPLFSGALYRLFVFAAIYVIHSYFLVGYAKKIEKKPQHSLVYEEDRGKREMLVHFLSDNDVRQMASNTNLKRATAVFGLFVLLMITIITISPHLSGIFSYSLPVVALLFLVGGVVSAFTAGLRGKKLLSTLLSGTAAIAPGTILILMAASVKYIITEGQIMDTILFYAYRSTASSSPFLTVIFIYLIVLALNFFIPSGSAKAVLIMPIIAPLADLVGITRQTAVLAFCFGDGFSNMLYPTNPVLLISLGLAMISYPKWFRWTIKLQLLVFLATFLLLGLALKINYGPF